jgi:pimeloyl-ACP methyl ester carboxylesterase
LPTAELSRSALYFEISGPRDAPPILLINGWGSQLIAWHPEFVAMLEHQPLHVIRFDNRDVGLSQKFDDDERYTLSDMALDAADLARHLGHEKIHLLGASMGGMIAQLVALDHPELVASVALVYTAARHHAAEAGEAVAAFLGQPAPTSRDEALQLFVEREQFAGPGGFDLCDLAALDYDRCYCPSGGRRQYRAIATASDRTGRLANLNVPTTVLHGLDDRLIPADEGVHLARTIPQSELHLYAGMGHEVQRERWLDLVADIVRNIRRAPSQK